MVGQSITPSQYWGLKRTMKILNAELKWCRYWYYVEEDPVVPDEYYDTLKKLQYWLANHYDFLDTIGLVIHRPPSLSPLGYSACERKRRFEYETD